MSDSSIKLGLMPPLSGLVGIYGSEIAHAGQVACQEINENGGVLGRPLELIIEDDGSLPESAVSAAEKLLDEHHCSAIIGNLLSNSRIAVAYRVAETRRVPYLNFSFYEGSILSRYFFHFAALPNQQIDQMIPYMHRKFGPRMFFAGNNYEWPRGSIHAGKLTLENLGGEIVGEEYTPIGVDEETIDNLLDNVEAAQPDVFVPYFAGSDQVLLLTRFTERGLKDKIAVVMGHYDEMMASQLPPEVRDGFYSSNTYFMSIDSDQNKNYLSRLANLPDVNGIWPKGNGILTNFGESTYVCVKAFAEAANKAGSVGPEMLVKALRTISITAPQGKVEMLPEHHHARVNTYLAQCDAEGVFNIVKKFGTITPELPERYNHQRINHQATVEDDIRLQARMLEQLSEGILLVGSEDNVILYANSGADTMFGYGKGEMNGQGIDALLDPDAQNPHEKSQQILDHINQKGLWEGELQSIRKNGETLFCSSKITIFTHPVYGEVWLGSFNDITQRKLNETKLSSSLKLSQAMSDALTSYMTNPTDIQPIFEHMLDELLALTDSQYGFIGEIKTNDKGEPCLLTFAITDIAWNDETRAIYDQYGKTGFEFTNLNSLFGITIQNGELVISNDPSNDKRRGGLPDGHPPLNAYMGIPLMAGDTNVGMIGIANRAGGYNENLLTEILPLLRTFANIIVSSAQDTERLSIEDELQDREASLTTAQSIAQVGSWLWDIQTGDLKWSDEIYRIFGLEPQQFSATYEQFIKHIHPDDVDTVTAAVSDAVGDERKSYDIHHRVLRPSGEVRYVHERGIVFTDNNDKPIRMLGAVHDVTEQIQAQEDLRQSEEKLRNVFEKAGVGITQVSLDGNFVTVNPKLCDIVGYKENELMALTFQDITHPDDLEKDLSLMHQVLAGDFPSYSLDKRYIRKDKSIVWINLTVTLVRNSKKEPLYFISIIEDITSRKNAEEILKQHQQKLEEQVEERTQELRGAQDELVRKERLATLGNLTATVSHELRNPLGSMRTSCHIIERILGDDIDKRISNAIERTNKGIERCDRIIDELLDYTRITSINMVSTNIDKLISDLIDEHPFLPHIHVQHKKGLGELSLDVDPERLRRVLINLIDNGCHAMLVGDSTTEVKPDAELIIETKTEDNNIIIRVTDNGSGIPDDVLAKIFEPLFSTKGFGVGLGMPIVQQIVKQHHGRINIASNNTGTCISVILPINISSKKP